MKVRSYGPEYLFEITFLLETPWICFAENVAPVALRCRMGYYDYLYQ
jgi:hypothetical protein